MGAREIRKAEMEAVGITYRWDSKGGAASGTHVLIKGHYTIKIDRGGHGYVDRFVTHPAFSSDKKIKPRTRWQGLPVDDRIWNAGVNLKSILDDAVKALLDIQETDPLSFYVVASQNNIGRWREEIKELQESVAEEEKRLKRVIKEQDKEAKEGKK